MKFFLQAGAVLGLLGVALGAFGAHALRTKLEALGRVDTFDTAVRYQFYHAVALLAVGILLQLMPTNGVAVKYLNWAGNSFLLGTLIFSGSLYILCLTGITWLGAITPIGGLLLIIGWGLVFWAVGQ